MLNLLFCAEMSILQLQFQFEKDKITGSQLQVVKKNLLSLQCAVRAHNVNLYSVTLGWEFRQHKAVNVGKINENHASGCITMNSALSSPENCCVVPVLLPDNPALISSDTEDDVCSQENLKSMKKLMRCTYKHL